jgi:hypothetical protein
MNESGSETVFGVAAVVAGIGVVLLGLAPLALPILVLLALAAAPLVPVAIAGALVTAVVAGPVLAVRRLRRRRASRRGPGGSARDAGRRDVLVDEADHGRALADRGRAALGGA